MLIPRSTKTMMFRLWVLGIWFSCVVVTGATISHINNNPEKFREVNKNENSDRGLRNRRLVRKQEQNNESHDFIEFERSLSESRNENYTTFDIESLLDSFINERKKANASGTNSGTAPDDLGSSNNLATNDTTADDIRINIVKSQAKSCKDLKLGINTKTMTPVDLSYVYDVQMINSDSTSVDSYSIAVKVNQCSQQLLIDTYLKPYCDALSKEANDFRRVLVGGDEYDENFAIFVRGVDFGATTQVHTSGNGAMSCADTNGNCLQLESTNILYLDDLLNSNIMLSLNETAFRESLLHLIATSFNNGNILSCYKQMNQSVTSDVSSFHFSQGSSDAVSVIGEISAAPIVDKVSNSSSDIKSTQKRNTIIIVILVLSVVCNAMVGLFIFIRKYGISVTDIGSDNGSTISTSLRTGGSRAVVMFKHGLEKSKETAKTVSEFLVERYNQLKYQHEVYANRRQGRMALEDYDNNHLKGTIVIKSIDTMESVCSASFADELGMEMMLQQMDLESRSCLDTNKSVWFDNDVFANTSFASMAFSSNAFSFLSDKTMKNEITPAKDFKLSVDAAPQNCENTSNSQLEYQEQNKSPEAVEEHPSMQREDDDTKYFTEDEVLPYDEERSLRSKECSESSGGGSEFDDGEGNDDSLSFLQVILGDDGNSFNAVMVESTLDTSVADPSCVVNNSSHHSCNTSVFSSTTSLSTVAKERLYPASDTVDL